MIMKKLSIILLFVFALSSCQKEEVDLFITIQLENNDGPMTVGQAFTDSKGLNQKCLPFFNFYISDLELIDKKGETHHVLDYDLVRITNGNGACTFKVKVMPGVYKEVRFALGFNTVQQATDPTTLPTTDPLSDANDMYWAMSSTYIFTKYEGELDSDGDGSFDKALIYHIADPSYYRTVSLANGDIDVKASKTADNKLVLSLDHEKLFHPGGSADIDLINESYSQSIDSIAERFADNMSTAFSY